MRHPRHLILALATLLLAALSLAPSFSHVLEAVPRLGTWSPELWRETTVFNRQFEFFALVGAPIDVAAIVATVILAFSLRAERRAIRYACAGAAFLALGLVLWFAIVAPANAVLATWRPGPLPADFEQVRGRWEIGHMAVAGAKLLGFGLISLALLRARPAADLTAGG